MGCSKYRVRTIFNFLEIFTCNNCNEVYEYEYILIGRQIINIYKKNRKCHNDYMAFSYFKLLLKECILNNDYIYFFIEENEYNKIFDFLPIFLNEFKIVNIILL